VLQSATQSSCLPHRKASFVELGEDVLPDSCRACFFAVRRCTTGAVGEVCAALTALLLTSGHFTSQSGATAQKTFGSLLDLWRTRR